MQPLAQHFHSLQVLSASSVRGGYEQHFVVAEADAVCKVQKHELGVLIDVGVCSVPDQHEKSWRTQLPRH